MTDTDTGTDPDILAAAIERLSTDAAAEIAAVLDGDGEPVAAAALIRLLGATTYLVCADDGDGVAVAISRSMTAEAAVAEYLSRLPAFAPRPSSVRVWRRWRLGTLEHSETPVRVRVEP